MRPIHRSVCTLAALALVGGSASAQGRREPRPIEQSIERTAEAIAAAFEENVERWAETVERNAERWAEQIERHAEALANRIEVRVEARAEAAGQISERERELRERQRELERQQREIEREIQQQRREAQQQQQQRQREQQRQRQRTDDRSSDRGNDRRNWPEATEPFSRTVNLGRTGVVSLDNISGDITFTGTSGNDVRIEAIKHVRDRTEADARTRLPETRIEVSERPGRVDIRTVFARENRQYLSQVTYTIAVPSGAGVIVKAVSSDIRISNVKGELTVETVNGDLTINGAGAIRSVKTVSGDLNLTGIEGDVAGGSVNGDIIMRSLKGRSLRLDTVSGDVQLGDAEFDRVDIGSINGDIVYAGRLAKGGHYDVHTHNGGIRLELAGNPGLDVDANTFGDVASEFALKTALQTERGLVRNPNRRLRGTYGDGGATLLLRSFNGDITIAKR